MNINNEFLNEFKKLDKLLSEAYGEIHGVTAYVNEMKKYSQLNDDFHRLRKLRNIRNKLVHEVGFDEVDHVTREDIQYIKKFYNRFLKGEDPLIKLKSQAENKWRVIFIVFTVLLIISVILAIITNYFL